jgi:hypothetical protein
MAQVVLSAVGQAIGGDAGRFFGAQIGAAVDRAAVNALTEPVQRGPRLEGLRLTGASEGAAVPIVYGRARVAGQVIWAARFRERRDLSGGGKSGPKAVEYGYSLSFAVALCEGPIDGVGRVWADGEPMDMTGVAMRVHLGTETQNPDPLIEAVEGVGSSPRGTGAPAYRGTAYVVFEDLDLAPWGRRLPHLSFEVFRRPRVEGAAPGLEERLQGVCLIPGAGEFALATEPVLRRESLTRLRVENVNNGEGRPDLEVSLDRLQAQLPAVKRVTLVVGWFGDDLRAGACTVRPGVERAVKATKPFEWRAGGVGRSGARLLSQTDGRPNYGGTPADRTVVQAVASLKARGFEVTLLPFLFMDVPAGNGLPDPYGGAEQAAFPWRGRIATTGDAAAEVAAFFGTAAPEHFAANGAEAVYAGPDEWSWRRMVLHYARVAEVAGGVDAFLIGSEFRGLTGARAADGSFPAVAQLRALAAAARSILRAGTKISYAADWSEYAGVRRGSEALFQLDPLWADPNVDFVGIDWYPPLTDWRDGTAHLDALAGYEGPHDPAYLAARAAGGEAFDWFYASEADRVAQVRTPIADGAGEPWVWRVKDLKGWWENAHHDRPGGVRRATPTAWVPRSKPMRLVELGFPAVDKGANAPNLFLDAKSAESALPAFSDGARDDLGQRRALEAVLGFFDDPANNPVSPVYGGPMLEAADAWCWDARPFPDFPARSDVWADGANWTRGHWLNGRAGVGPGAELVGAILQRAGLSPAEFDASGARGAVAGYVLDRPMSAADALAPLGEVLDFDLAERGGRVAAVPRGGSEPSALSEDDLASDEAGEALSSARALGETPSLLRARFYDAEADYRTGTAAARVEGEGGAADADLPVVIGTAQAEAVLKRSAARLTAARRSASVRLAPSAALRLQPGDVVTAPGLDGPQRVLRVDLDERPRAAVLPASTAEAGEGEPDWRSEAGPRPSGPAGFVVLDAPAAGGNADARPWIAAAAEPWRPTDVWAGPTVETLTLRARIQRPATVGELLGPLPPSGADRWLRGAEALVRLEGGAALSRPLTAVLGGANLLAVRATDGNWELVGFTGAAPTGPEQWRLSGLIRGTHGSDGAARAGAAAGATVVILDGLTRAEVSASERGAALVWRAVPAGSPPGGPLAAELEETWRGAADRPWAPARLRLTASGGDLIVNWVRRDRGSDRWDAEPALEEAERYRVEVRDGASAVRTVETAAPTWAYTAAARAEDFSGGAPKPLTVSVARYGAAWGGFGVAATQALVW